MKIEHKNLDQEFMNAIRKRGNQAVDYVKSKYQIDFSPYSYDLADYLSDTDYVWCHAETLNAEYESIKIAISIENNAYAYKDNYFTYHIRPEIEKTIENMLTSYFSNVKLYYSGSYLFLPNELTGEQSLNDLLSIRPAFSLDANIFIPYTDTMTKDDYNVHVENITKDLKDHNRHYKLNIFVIGKEMFDQLNRYSQKLFFDDYYQLKEPDNKTYYYSYEITV